MAGAKSSSQDRRRLPAMNDCRIMGRLPALLHIGGNFFPVGFQTAVLYIYEDGIALSYCVLQNQLRGKRLQ